MKLPTSGIIVCTALLTLSAVIPGQVFATLGERADSVDKDRKALAAVKRATTTQANYTVQEVASAGVTVREYVSPSGVVFAVAWNGYTWPDLSVLLGSYHQEYKVAKQQTPRRHGQRQQQIVSGNVVVETWGHMRNLQGRAYVPSLVPAGVNINEIH